jgi:hypothetical protein
MYSGTSGTILGSPFLGMTWLLQPLQPHLRNSSMQADFAQAMLSAAANGNRQAQGLLCRDLSSAVLDAAVRSVLPGGEVPSVKWLTIEYDVQHLGIVLQLVCHGANVNAHTTSQLDTPLTLAAEVNNAAVVDMLCRMGADIEHMRYAARVHAFLSLLSSSRAPPSLHRHERTHHTFSGAGCQTSPGSCIVLSCRADGARALDVAAAKGRCLLGWTLMCHGALAVPDCTSDGGPRLFAGNDPPNDVQPPVPSLATASLLMCHAVQSQQTPW